MLRFVPSLPLPSRLRRGTRHRQPRAGGSAPVCPMRGRLERGEDRSRVPRGSRSVHHPGSSPRRRCSCDRLPHLPARCPQSPSRRSRRHPGGSRGAKAGEAVPATKGTLRAEDVNRSGFFPEAPLGTITCGVSLRELDAMQVCCCIAVNGAQFAGLAGRSSARFAHACRRDGLRHVGGHRDTRRRPPRLVVRRSQNRAGLRGRGMISGAIHGCKRSV